MLFYKKSSYIYVSGFSILNAESIYNQIGINIYRFIVGLTGSFNLLIITKKIYIKIIKRYNKLEETLAYIGKYTLGIYIISSFICLYLLKTITINFVFNPFIILIETICIFVISLILSILISRQKYLNKLLLGGR